MAANIAHNLIQAIEGLPVNNVIGWLDSTVALHWIKGNGQYKPFVANRVQKIREKQFITWRHVGTDSNPADIGSRGGLVNEESDLWFRGPSWLSDPSQYPEDITTCESEESRAESRIVREVLGVSIKRESDTLDDLLDKYNYTKAMRVTAWIKRFVHNARNKKANLAKGPLTSSEVQQAMLMWELRCQRDASNSDTLQEDRLQLNLQPNNESGLLECRGRVQGEYPIYLPDDHTYTQKLAMNRHLATLHGGVGLTMTKVRERYWVPRLRRLVKRVVKSCYGCRRFQAHAFAFPPPSPLPTDRTQGGAPFQVVGIDYAGPLKYRSKGQSESKAYIVVYSCSLTRGLYLDVLPNMETPDFLRSLKRFIARRGRPRKIYSDNARTFIGAAKWVKQVMQDERVQGFLTQQGIIWQFNLCRAPWWGGQFERMVGLIKSALYKSIGGGLLTWAELTEVILDIEVALNSRPLSYVEEDIQLPVLTPNAMIFVQDNTLPELQPYHIQDYDLRKRVKYLTKCKDALWRRWKTEYLRGLREQHRLKHKGQTDHPKPGDAVIIKSEEKNRGKWQLGVVDSLIVGRDGVVRGARLRAGKGFLERPVQHLYPLELSCDRPVQPHVSSLNPDAAPYRPRRDAAVAAGFRVRDVITAEENE